MNLAGERDVYLQKAEWAEQMAAQFAPNTFYHESWMQIAKDYRDLLARLDHGRDSNIPEPEC